MHFLIRYGLRLLAQPLFLCAIAPAAAAAQDPVRPWLEWRTITTATHRLHFPRELEQVARDVAGRVEGIDSAIAVIVGSRAPKPIDVVIDDPYTIANGYALPLMDSPVTVWWATPADPRSDIGNFTAWSEMLAIHELTHLAHLTRPSRNPLQRALWSVIPAKLGPVAQKAPRWVYEGYATLVEGRVSGTGRPNNAWRPALLRQWAIEGRLPTYGQLNGTADFNGLQFAYLNGSAFLDWLTRRAGDSSLVDVWRRLSARRVRGFDSAFAGVYGDFPAVLYGRHSADVTRDAMAAKAALERAGLVEGELVQRLAWATGDPAVSPDGERVALVLRERERPSRVVVWKTAAEPEDSAAARRRALDLRRDPEDVPARRPYPPAKRPDRTLFSLNGRGWHMPRWFADNRRVLLTRWIPRADGSVSSALYVWDTGTRSVRRATDAIGVQHGDPHPNGTEAVAMQCHWGHCDVTRVDLERGAVTTLLEGNARVTYYRPRWSPDARRIAASMIDDSGRWRVVVADREGRAPRVIGPEDGANRYDAQWLGDDTLVVVSERGGIPNLELIAVTDGGARALTRVTGAAVGPDVNRRDGSIWFLNMHARGFDVRRIASGSAPADSAVAIDAERFGFAGARRASPVPRPAGDAPAPRGYAQSRRSRWLPGAVASADGVGGTLSIYSGDIVGRLTGVTTGAIGGRGAWRGAASRWTWRGWRPAIEIGAFSATHEPSRGRYGTTIGNTLDARASTHGLLALSAATRGDGWRVQSRVGGALGELRPASAPTFTRAIGFVDAELFGQQVSHASGVTHTLRLHGARGESQGRFHRVLASLELATVGRDMPAAEFRVTAGRLIGDPHPFEWFAIGGGASPLLDSALVRQRYVMPMLPTGVGIGRALMAWRAALPMPLTVFYEGASVAPALSSTRVWHRTLGLERGFTYGPVPVGYLPRVEIRGGAAYLLDPPFRKTVRGFLEMRLEP